MKAVAGSFICVREVAEGGAVERRRVGKIALDRTRSGEVACGDFAHAVASPYVVRVGKIAAGSGATVPPRQGDFAHPTTAVSTRPAHGLTKFHDVGSRLEHTWGGRSRYGMLSP